MPTRYTAAVKDGEITDFPAFAMQCARAFGALITMRDEPWDAEVPESFDAHTTYHDTAIEKARADLERLYAMTTPEVQEAAEEDWQAHVAHIAEINEKRAIERQRYESMLTQVRAWEPPTTNHVELKTFMIQQLELSIDFDCKPWDVSERPTPEGWWSGQLSEAQRSLSYHTEQREKEIQRARERTAWVRHLRASLEPQEATR